jgi:hypothetical protein
MLRSFFQAVVPLARADEEEVGVASFSTGHLAYGTGIKTNAHGFPSQAPAAAPPPPPPKKAADLSVSSYHRLTVDPRP